ncbi:MAG: hypothetical protein BroJett015_43500 [Chloroflexota bacterium]|nr:hypothetical protein [Ardenticatenaceae bacterium]MBL1130397.1 hypothetical protein [Chloroflexota bacterium]GIK58687.1 MAG: hypothetical protein BroJett015_43500 [Chloroflexota bacterium]
MANKPLRSLGEYSQLVAELQNRPLVERSTITVWSDSPYTAVAEGELFFANGFRLRMREELDFDDQRITSYGYEVYRNAERLYWYDDFPHPNDPTLASTHPHHKHVPPNIKRNRIPAPGLSFTTPNLPQIIQEIEALITASNV